MQSASVANLAALADSRAMQFTGSITGAPSPCYWPVAMSPTGASFVQTVTICGFGPAGAGAAGLPGGWNTV